MLSDVFSVKNKSVDWKKHPNSLWCHSFTMSLSIKFGHPLSDGPVMWLSMISCISFWALVPSAWLSFSFSSYCSPCYHITWNWVRNKLMMSFSSFSESSVHCSCAHYHPYMRVGNAFGHICLCVCVSACVCVSVCLSVCPCVCVSIFSGYNFWTHWYRNFIFGMQVHLDHI